MAKYDLNYSRRSRTLYSGSCSCVFPNYDLPIWKSGEKWYNRNGGGLRCTRITSGIPMTCQGLPGGSSTTEISFVNDGVGGGEETKHHRDDLYLTPKPDPKKTQYGLNSILPDICRPNMAKYDLNYSRRSLTLYSGSVPAFFRIMTSQFGSPGKSDTTGMVAGSVVPELPLAYL